MATSADGLAQVTDYPGYMRDSCRVGSQKEYDVHLCDGGMQLRNRDRDQFANVTKVNNGYTVGFNVIPPRTAFAACTTDGDDTEPTHDELLNETSRQGCDGGHGKGSRRHKGDAVDLARHPSFKTVVALAESGANGMVITDLPEKICVRCMCRSESSTLPA